MKLKIGCCIFFCSNEVFSCKEVLCVKGWIQSRRVNDATNLRSLSSSLSASNFTHYFSPTSLSNSPARALLLGAAVLLAYWFLSLFLGGFFYLLHAIFGPFYWLARVALFALSCLYILQKFEGDPERAVLPLCFVMGVYFMTGPVGAYWRRSVGPSTLEEKIDQLDTQIRLLNIRLSRVIDNLERSSEQ